MTKIILIARRTFRLFTPKWNLNSTKLKIFVSNVKTVLPYGCKSWKVSKSIRKNTWKKGLQTNAYTKCCRFPGHIQLQMNSCEEIGHRKRSWLGHIICRQNNIAAKTLKQNSRGRETLKTTWKRSLLDEAEMMSKTWRKVRQLAHNQPS